MRILAAVLGVLGLLFILAGPAFNLLPGRNGYWIFTAIACWVVGGAISAFLKKAPKQESK